jgi:protein-tyrosine phosphatase
VDVARRHGITLTGQARKLEPEDLHDFDHVIAMDRDNLRAIRALADSSSGGAEVSLLRDFDPDPGDGEVPDPYYGGPSGFDDVFEMVRRSAEALLDRLAADDG